MSATPGSDSLHNFSSTTHNGWVTLYSWLLTITPHVIRVPEEQGYGLTVRRRVPTDHQLLSCRQQLLTVSNNGSKFDRRTTTSCVPNNNKQKKIGIFIRNFFHLFWNWYSSRVEIVLVLRNPVLLIPICSRYLTVDMEVTRKFEEFLLIVFHIRQQARSCSYCGTRCDLQQVRSYNTSINSNDIYQ